MRSLVWLLLLTLGTACGDSEVAGADAGGELDMTLGPVLGETTRGQTCTGGCGSDDNRKCSVSNTDCPLCLVDPDHVRLTYCTQDCTAQPCPVGWSCEAIKAFGQDDVERACVADAAVCGDGTVQLGEVCDGDDPQLGRCDACSGYVAACGDGVLQEGEVCEGDDPQLGECVDCMGYRSICGDGVLQADEACDGDGPEGYCVDDCWRRLTPYVTFRPLNVQTRGVQRQEETPPGSTSSASTARRRCLSPTRGMRMVASA